MSRPIKIVDQTRTYLNNALHIIKNLPEDQQLLGAAELLVRILEIEDEYQAAYLELRGILGLRTRLE